MCLCNGTMILESTTHTYTYAYTYTYTMVLDSHYQYICVRVCMPWCHGSTRYYMHVHICTENEKKYILPRHLHTYIHTYMRTHIHTQTLTYIHMIFNSSTPSPFLSLNTRLRAARSTSISLDSLRKFQRYIHTHALQMPPSSVFNALYIYIYIYIYMYIYICVCA